MAGSLQKFLYFDDDGNGKLVNLDESTQRAFGNSPATTLSIGSGSRKIQKLSGGERYVTLQGQTAGGRLVSRSVVVLTKANPLFVNGGSVTLPVLTGGSNEVSEQVNFQITQAVGEVKKFALLEQDTGLDDGTQP